MVTTVWDQTAAVNSVLVENIPGAGCGVVSFNVSGTLTAGVITFEVSDNGTNFYPIPGLVQSTFAIFNNWQPSFGSDVAMQINVAGFQFWRFRLSTVLTGTGNVTVLANTFPNTPFTTLMASVQQFGPNLHVTLDDSSGTGTANVTTKGTQGANALNVQELKDAGRTMKVLSAAFTAATTEALVTLTPVIAGVAGATGTSFTVTSGKTFRVQSLMVTTKNAGAAIQGVVCNLRMASTGAITATSSLIATVGAGTLAATANNVASESADIPDGLEFTGTMQFGISQLGTATAGNTVTLIGYEY